MLLEIKEYLRNLLKYGARIKSGDSLMVNLPENDEVIINIFEELKEEFKIEKIVYNVENFKELYDLLKNINMDEIEDYVPNLNIDSNMNKVKVIEFVDDTMYSYRNKLWYGNDEISDKCDEYSDLFYKKNPLYEDMRYNNFAIVSCVATNNWAETLYGDKTYKSKLWEDILRCVPGKDLKKEIKRLNDLKRYLNGLDIRDLYFYTDLGTELKVGLTPHSNWVYDLSYNGKGTNFSFVNFPTYEIFTAPDMYKTSGRVVVSKPSIIDGYKVSSGEILFNRGFVTSISMDNKDYEERVLKRDNKLRRLGEIALVSNSSPISWKKDTFYNLLLDENSFCHIALGDSNDDSFNIPKKNKKQFYHFYQSELHDDIVFGDDSVNVLCKTFDGKKKVLMHNGKWMV